MADAIIDTGPIKALFDESDKYSSPIRAFLKDFRGTLFTTLPVITEVSYLLDDNKDLQLGFIEWVSAGGVTVIPIHNADFKSIHRYMKKYSDTPMDLADASLVFIAEAMQNSAIVTLDTDFDVYRLPSGRKFKNLTRNLIRTKRSH